MARDMYEYKDREKRGIVTYVRYADREKDLKDII